MSGDRFQAANGDQVEYRAFLRRIKDTDGGGRSSVISILASLTKPDSGWRFMLAEQAGEPDTWQFLEEPPAFTDGVRSFYAVCSNTGALEEIPKAVKVKEDGRTRRVTVKPWRG